MFKRVAGKYIRELDFILCGLQWAKAAENALWTEHVVRETPKQKLKDYLVKMPYRAFLFLLDSVKNP